DPRDGRTLADLFADLQPPPTVHPALPEAPTRGVNPGFTDDAQAVGLRFVFDKGQTPDRMLPETVSGGVGLLDANGDGWLDVYVVQGGPFPPQAPRGTAFQAVSDRGQDARATGGTAFQAVSDHGQDARATGGTAFQAVSDHG